MDTCGLSDDRRKIPAARFWLDGTDDALLHISVLTLGEITRGIVQIEPTDPRQAARLWAWLTDSKESYTTRIPPVGAAVATALTHGLIVVTRNVADFADTGIEVINPWGA